ncbi:MAG: MaoC/PaaZ C-terminal domain-containing protein, partial [Afipia sp.]|nr:MaoC/PaaZ C-terminal domain-containing protein [Afipia sp.]
MSTTRISTMNDQLRFAQLSGDHNPLHINPDWASTRYPGQVVIHGVHALLWALDATLKQERITALSVTFIKPILIGDKVTAQLDGHILTASVRGEMVIRTKIGGVENTAGNSPPIQITSGNVPWLGRTGTVLLPGESSALASE